MKEKETRQQPAQMQMQKTQEKQHSEAKPAKPKKKLKYKSLNCKLWGIDFNKNEYQEIILSNSNHPEIM